MKIQNPQYAKQVRAIFNKAHFIRHLGIRFKKCGPGWCETDLSLRAYHHQQDDFIHAGVIATLADHTAGAAAGTLVKEGEVVLTVEFKINLLRPAQGKKLRCRARVLKGGRNLSVVESEVFAVKKKTPLLVAKAMVTLAIVSLRAKPV